MKVDYEQSMKKSMIQLALIKPDVKGLEDEEIEPPPKESKGEDSCPKMEQLFVSLHFLSSSTSVMRLSLYLFGPL